MERADESKIRDPDLKARLEEARGKFVFEVVARTLVAEQEKRDRDAAKKAEREAKLAAMPRERRRRAVIREVLESKPPLITDIRHIHSVLAVCGLPYGRLPVEERRFERRQGNMSLVIHAGEILTPKGEWVPQPLPFGPKARLILMHLCSEAVRQKSATIDIADTFTAFVRELGFADNGGRGGALTAFRQQLNALAACDIRIGAFDGLISKTKSFKPIDDFEVWLSNDPAQQSLWPSTLTFSSTMFDSLQRHAIPVNLGAARAFAGSARKLDLYFWLGWRIHNLNAPLQISWEALSIQFGQGFTRKRAFRAKLAEEITQIREVLPKLPIILDERGLRLQPADPSVLALPAPKPAKSKNK
jgi:hypothetical protein